MNFICLNCGMNVKKIIEEDATCLCTLRSMIVSKTVRSEARVSAATLK